MQGMDETPEEVQEETPEVAVPQEEEVVESQEPQEENAVKADRTKQQFEKLKKSNKELQEERDAYKNLFESIRPVETPVAQAPIPQADQFQNLNQQQIDQTLQSMVDENGMLDGNKLMQTLSAMDERAKKAEQAVQEIRSEKQKETMTQRDKEEKAAQTQVYEKYPQLNPEGEDFDPKFWQYVYNDLAVTAKKGQMPSETDYMVSADKVYEDLYEGRDMTKKGKEEATKKEEQKRQINATRPRSNIAIGHYNNQEDDALLKQVQQGKRGAVGELLRRKGL